MTELPLPLYPPAGADPWQLPHPFPTTLLALWPGTRPPLQETAAETLVHHAPECMLVGEMSAPPEGCLWTVVADLPAPIDSRVVLFAEPTDPQGAADLDEACRACRWMIGVELLLPRERPLRSLVAAMRIADAVATGTPAVLDVASNTWHGRDSLDRWFIPSDADPPEWLLWTAHAVCRDREYRAGQPAWIRTSGLWRCGLPELELLDIPAELVRPGVTLVHAVAELLLEEPLPQPATPWTIGRDLAVALVPWQEIAPLLPDDVPGSLASRRLEPSTLHSNSLEHPLGGVRATICGPKPTGSYRKVWAPPSEVLARLAAGDALLHQSAAGSRRTHRLARRTLPAFIAAVQRRAVEAGVAPEGNDASPQPAFRALVAAAFDPTAGRFISDAGSDSHQTDPRESHDDAGDDLPLDHLSAVGRSRPSTPADDQFGEGPREHLWIELDHIVGPTAHGRLVNDVDSSAELRAGCQVTVATDAISDWQVIGGGIVLTPDEADWLAEAVQAWLGSGLESGLGHKLGGGAGSGQ